MLTDSKVSALEAMLASCSADYTALSEEARGEDAGRALATLVRGLKAVLAAHAVSVANTLWPLPAAADAPAPEAPSPLWPRPTAH